MPSYIYVLVQTVGNSGVDPYLYSGPNDFDGQNDSSKYVLKHRNSSAILPIEVIQTRVQYK